MSVIQQFTDPIKTIVRLYIEDTKLSLVEKITKILSAIAIVFVTALLVIIGITFVSFGITTLLADILAPQAAYFIVGGFYIILLALVIIFRQKLIINPIARYMSKTLLDSPENQTINSQSHE